MLTTGFQSVAPLISRAASSLLILASSVCKSLQCLISALTQGGEGGHLFRLTCWVCCRVRGILQTVITGLCGECLQCMDHAGFAPAQFLAACVLCGSAGKESTCSVGDLGSIPGLGGSPGEGKGYPIQYSDLENSMDCIIHWVTNWTCPLGHDWAAFTFTFLAPVLSRSTLLRLQVALKGNCPKRALGCMHFPGLSCSGSGSRVLHKGRDSVGPAFCALPRSRELRQPGAFRAHYPRCVVHLITSLAPAARFPGCIVKVPSQLCRVSSGGLISCCNPPNRCQPSRIPGRVG